jgi:hypothetical protein
MAAHLTAENHERLLDEAEGKSRRQVEEMIAAAFPAAGRAGFGAQAAGGGAGTAARGSDATGG